MLSVWPPGKLGGLGGTSLPNTEFNCVMPSVTDVVVVNVTALLTRFPYVLVPMAMLLPMTPTLATDDQDRFPVPSVDKM